MTKQNVIKTIDQMINDVDCKWVRIAQFQSWNEEQTNSSSFQLEDIDYQCNQNESEIAPYEWMSLDDLKFLNDTLSFKMLFHQTIMSVHIDTFGENANKPICIILSHYEEVDWME